MLHRFVRTLPHARLAAALAGLSLCLAGPCTALNQRIYPLKEMVADAKSIAVGRVAAVDQGEMRVVLVADEILKGNAAWRWMGIDLKSGGWGHPPILMRRLAPGLPVVIFRGEAKGQHVAVVYTNGTWFRVTASAAPQDDRLQWALANLEILLPRSFSGPTEKLARLVRDHITRGTPLPAPSTTVVRPYGPELPANYQPNAPLPSVPSFLRGATADAIQVLEAEGLVILSSTMREASAGWVMAQYTGTTWFFYSSCGVLRCSGYSGESVELGLPVERDGTYDLAISASGLRSLATLNVLVDGQPVKPSSPWPPPTTDGPNTLRGEPATVTYGPVTLTQGGHRLLIQPETEAPDGWFSISLDVLALLPPGGMALSSGDIQTLSAAGVPQGELSTALELERAYWKTASEVARLYRQAKGRWNDVRWSLYLERAMGRGGSRGARRDASVILAMKQSDPWLTWLDVRGVLMTAGELFMPTRDAAVEIMRLRKLAHWDELDPALMASKFGSLSLDQWEVQRRRELRPAALLAGEQASKLLLAADRAHPLTSGWAACSKTTTNVRPSSAAKGALLEAYGCDGSPLRAAPPPGQTAAWFAAPRAASANTPFGFASGGRSGGPGGPPGLGGPPGFGGPGQPTAGDELSALMYWRQGMVTIDARRAASYLIEARVWVPDHVEEVGETIPGFIYVRHPSRYIGVGVQFAASDGTPVGGPAERLRLEPRAGTYDTLLIRVDVYPGGSPGAGTALIVTAYTRDRGEDGRSLVFLPAGALKDGKLRFALALGLGPTTNGYVPEFHLCSVRIAQVVTTPGAGSATQRKQVARRGNR